MAELLTTEVEDKIFETFHFPIKDSENYLLRILNYLVNIYGIEHRKALFQVILHYNSSVRIKEKAGSKSTVGLPTAPGETRHSRPIRQTKEENDF